MIVLKFITMAVFKSVAVSFNRTMIVLKSEPLNKLFAGILGFNRTMIVLKYLDRLLTLL